MNIADVSFKIGKQKRIALVAHDGKKDDMVKWVDKNKNILKIIFYVEQVQQHVSYLTILDYL